MDHGKMFNLIGDALYEFGEEYLDMMSGADDPDSEGFRAELDDMVDGFALAIMKVMEP